MPLPPLIILGASTRAAAFSALRAGLQPWCVDLFADRDLQRHCLVERLSAPTLEAIRPLFDAAPKGPWMYTGGMENRPRIINALASSRELWGVAGTALMAARDPFHLARIVKAAGLPVLEVSRTPPLGDAANWLMKARRSAGGSGVQFASPSTLTPDFPVDRYWQVFQAGDKRPLDFGGCSFSALYCGNGFSAQLLGLSRQLIGVPWLHAGPFQYCGSIGPLDPEWNLEADLRQLGNSIVSGCTLRGLFGIDGIRVNSRFYPVEINPRYTASMELLDHAGILSLAWHRAAFDASAPIPPPPSLRSPSQLLAKAILFAPDDLMFPEDGPWLREFQAARPLTEIPEFADIPYGGERIAKGRPVMTFFVRASSMADCEDALRVKAREFYQQLYPHYQRPAPSTI